MSIVVICHMDEQTTLARSIAALREAHHLKLAAVSRKLPASTVHAIESGALVPAPRTLDLLTAAFHLPPGYFDRLSLAVNQKPHQQQALVDRLLHGGVTPPAEIRQILMAVAAQPNLGTVSQSMVALLIARTWLHEGETTTAIDRLQPLYDQTRTMRGSLRIDIVNSLARAYLLAHQPQQALSPLLEVTSKRIQGRGRESAMYNLGLAWWTLGHYDAASNQWQHTIDQASDSVLRAHAHMGLGNANLRRGQFEEALAHYRDAYNGYRDVASPSAVLALNNITMCHIQAQEWDAARATLEAIPSDQHLSAAVQGQIWATRAELARGLGQNAEACHAIESAKTLIGDAPISSWFTIRFLEIELSQNSVTDLVENIEIQLSRVPDPFMVAALRVRLVQLALAAECWDEAAREATALSHTLPIII